MTDVDLGLRRKTRSCREGRWLLWAVDHFLVWMNERCVEDSCWSWMKAGLFEHRYSDDSVDLEGLEETIYGEPH